MAVRVSEHLDLRKNDSAITQHIQNCNSCFNGNLNLSNFKILTKCNSDFDTQINEAFFIQNSKPNLNAQLFNSGKSFLLNIYN